MREAISTAAAGSVTRYELAALGSGSRLATVDFSLKPIWNDDGEVELLIAEGREITERKRVEAALQQREEALREAQRVAGVGSWVWDAATGAITWTEELYRIVDLDPDQPAPQNTEHGKYLTEESEERLNAAFESARRSGNTV